MDLGSWPRAVLLKLDCILECPGGLEQTQVVGSNLGFRYSCFWMGI